MNTKPLPLNELLGYEVSDKRIDILRRIGQVGSISEAARAAGVSYKAAWQALETLTNLAGVPLVEKSVGGSGGGGARLTHAGQQVLMAAQEMAAVRQQVLARLAGTGLSGQAALALRTSMRNQFSCTVGTLTTHEGQVRVQLLLAPDSSLYSRVTRESVQLLGLEPGLSVLALCKATSVQIAAQGDQRVANNVLMGVVSRTTRSEHGGEATLQLSDGTQLIGFTQSGPPLMVGDQAVAFVDESSVVIGLSH
jgi:molybdate transport system regulatory protein